MYQSTKVPMYQCCESPIPPRGTSQTLSGFSVLGYRVVGLHRITAILPRLIDPSSDLRHAGVSFVLTNNPGTLPRDSEDNEDGNMGDAVAGRHISYYNTYTH